MDQQTIFLTILGMMAVTYIPRALPLLALASGGLSEGVVRWLGHVPTAVLAALLAPEILVRNEALDVGLDNVFLLAACPTLLVAWKTKSFFGAVLTGIGSVALLRLLAV
ncbi:MAG: AzlD domain-containing protein [Deltaproteobacteria bacterium]|nr:AzlD domain-containing protein [Deltaproteobacteria bacterium]